MIYTIKKYTGHPQRKRISLLLPLILFQLFLGAQEERNGLDTIKNLEYQVVDTVVQVDTAVPSTQESYSEEAGDEDKIEYFAPQPVPGRADTLRLRHLSGKAVKALRDDDAFWYANESFKKKEPKNSSRGIGFLGSNLFQTLLWLVIIGGFATFLILYLHNSNVGLFRRSTTVAEEEAGLESNDIFGINYQKEIDKAVSAGDYRLATRLLFLRLLRTLSDKNLIQYRQDSTNFDYMMQLRTTPMYTDFFRLTRNYEYSWYGHFDVDKDKYSVIKNDFENFENRLNR